MEIISSSIQEFNNSTGNGDLEDRSSQLKILQKEIKQWERSFVKEVGRKPTSEEIRSKGMGKSNSPLSQPLSSFFFDPRSNF